MSKNVGYYHIAKQCADNRWRLRARKESTRKYIRIIILLYFFLRVSIIAVDIDPVKIAEMYGIVHNI